MPHFKEVVATNMFMKISFLHPKTKYVCTYINTQSHLKSIYVHTPKLTMVHRAFSSRRLFKTTYHQPTRKLLPTSNYAIVRFHIRNTDRRASILYSNLSAACIILCSQSQALYFSLCASPLSLKYICKRSSVAESGSGRSNRRATFTEVLKFVICYVPMPGGVGLRPPPQVNFPQNSVFPALILLF